MSISYTITYYCRRGSCFRMKVSSPSYLTLQFLVFALVASAFSTVYITQPVLPILQKQFSVNISWAALSVSAVTLGMALSNLPFGMLADRFPVRYLILTGGTTVVACGFFCAFTNSYLLLLGARFLQGLFIPSLTTCLAAYLASNLPADRLNVVMGSYVSATVAGGLGGRLLGGFIHPPWHWRYAFITASIFLLCSTLAAVKWLPPGKSSRVLERPQEGFWALLTRPDLWRIFLVPFSGFFVFSSIFNYLPFYLASPPFQASTQFITLFYLSYLMGVLIGPLAGKLSNRIGNGGSMIGGSILLAGAVLLTLIKSLALIAVALIFVCAGFFTIHAAAAGSLNLKLTASRGRANSLYVLLYYLGGSIGINLSGYAYSYAGWSGVVWLGVLVLFIPLYTGCWEFRSHNGK
jgi:MFS transporter, YNFM family, putative membrane transport protein